MNNTIVIKNKLSKFAPSQQREITKALTKLHNQIETQASYGIPFEKIYNNAAIKYDNLGQDFYTFKAHGRDKSQIRILYRFIRQNDIYHIELHKVIIKRNNDNSYIKEFRDYVDYSR